MPFNSSFFMMLYQRIKHIRLCRLTHIHERKNTTPAVTVSRVQHALWIKDLFSFYKTRHTQYKTNICIENNRYTHSFTVFWTRLKLLWGLMKHIYFNCTCFHSSCAVNLWLLAKSSYTHWSRSKNKVHENNTTDTTYLRGSMATFHFPTNL